MARDEENAKRLRNEWYQRNKELTKQRAKAWELANPDRKKEIKAKSREKFKEEYNAKNREWNKANKDKKASYEAKRRAIQLQRTPKWLNEDDFWMMEEAYSLAKLRTQMLGIPFHVDHVIPLQGRNVCGLHTPYNLQVIPAKENLSKSNKHEV